MIRIGQKLQEERIQKGLTIEQVSKAIRIRPSFLTAIEKGEYSRLPSSTYAAGFVRNYAEFLGLPKKEVSALFRREFDEEKVFRVLPESLSHSNEIFIHRLRIQQTVLLCIVVLIGLLGYILFQYRYAIINPPLEVTSPKQKQVSKSPIVVSGTTDPNATVSVNGELVSIDSEGSFAKKLDVFPGKTTITIRAKNKFGKETVIRKTVELK